MSKAVITESLLTDIADAIRAKTGGAGTLTPAQMALAISNIAQSGKPMSYDDDVLFIDYDGSLVYTYTADEFLSFTDMPQNPSHEGLISQGWNWPLADAQAYIAKYGRLVIGQNYITSDGKTRLYISLPYSGTYADTLTIQVAFYDRSDINNAINIDWGDGVNEDYSKSEYATDGQFLISHTYAAAGDYVIAIDFPSYIDGRDDVTITLGSSTGASLVQYAVAWETSSRVLADPLIKIEIGDYISSFAGKLGQRLQSITVPVTTPFLCIGRTRFQDCFALRGLVIPYVPGTTPSLNYLNFHQCFQLQAIACPPNLAFSTQTSFSGCYKLSTITMPEATSGVLNKIAETMQSLTYVSIADGVTATCFRLFYQMYALMTVVLPSTLTSIVSGTFASCRCQRLVMLAETPPTLAAADAIPDSLKVIEVPYSDDHSILEVYKAATNWATYADIMVEKEA